jgi:hypothetical protein
VSANVDAATPVTEVSSPSVIVVGVIPGALAVRVVPPVVAAVVPDAGAEVGADDLLELPQALHSRVAIAATTNARSCQ